jgi:hypothetical protein
MRIIPGLYRYWSVVPDQHYPTADCFPTSSSWKFLKHSKKIHVRHVRLVARRLAVRQARVRFSVRLHREVNPTEFTSDEEMEERGPGEWMWLNECMLYKYEIINKKSGVTSCHHIFLQIHWYCSLFWCDALLCNSISLIRCWLQKYAGNSKHKGQRS